MECQLDALGKCLSVGAAEKALRELPDSLDKTYDRIFQSIPQHYQRPAHCMLQFLVVCPRPLTLREVAQIVAVDAAGDEFDYRKDQLQDYRDVLDLCSSLVSLST